MFSGALPATVFRGMYRRTIMPPVVNGLPTPGNRRYDQARVRLRRTIAALIAERRNDPADHGDLLSALLAARDAEGDDRAMTDAEISDQVMTFFLGGPESTANLIAWALYLLARHPDVAERVRAEADTVLGSADGTAGPAPHELARLELTRQALTETLRLYPPLWMLTRCTTTRGPSDRRGTDHHGLGGSERRRADMAAGG